MLRETLDLAQEMTQCVGNGTRVLQSHERNQTCQKKCKGEKYGEEDTR
jgi:hypothetical protein